jgi:hypothetical protein
MAQGTPLMEELHPRQREPFLAVAPVILLAALLLLLGVWIPAPLRAVLSAAASAVGGGA